MEGLITRQQKEVDRLDVNIVSFPHLPRKRVHSMVAFKAWAIPSEVVKASLNVSFICGTQLQNVATSAHHHRGSSSSLLRPVLHWSGINVILENFRTSSPASLAAAAEARGEVLSPHLHIRHVRQIFIIFSLLFLEGVPVVVFCWFSFRFSLLFFCRGL